MPPKSSLPLQDGRAGLPHPSQHNDSDYSDDDIRLLSEIVELAEDVYPTLPERDRLPTYALFQAAEQILPAHGYDPENAPSHISRLIFKIGGQRSGETLSDKFRAVLEGIGIRIEYVESSPYERSPAVRRTRDHVPSDDETSPVDLSFPDRIPNRRHSSESQPLGPPLPSQASYDLPLRPRSSSPSDFLSTLEREQNQRSGDTRGLLDLPARPPARLGSHQENTDASGAQGGSKWLLESPLITPNAPAPTRPNSDDSDGFGGASDTTAQTEDEDEYPQSPEDETSAANTAALEVVLQQSRMQYAGDLLEDAFFVWHHIANETKQDNKDLHSYAVETDDKDIITEVLEVWNQATVLAQEARLEAQAVAEHEAYVEKMERRASRVYQIITIRNALAHWQAQARDERDRTAVARRHLVRKRAFDNWRAQHIEDENKVVNFVLINALQKWGQDTLYHQIRQKVAIRHHAQGMVIEALHTMWEEHKERLADDFCFAGIAENCLTVWHGRTRNLLVEEDVAIEVHERLICDAVINIWADEMEDLQITAHDAAIQMIVRDCKHTLQDWHEQARLESLLRHYYDTEDERCQRRALETWHTATVDAQNDREFADGLLMENPLNLWWNTTKLYLFIDEINTREKRKALDHWACEERAAWFGRYEERRFLNDTLDQWKEATAQAVDARVKGTHNSSLVYNYRLQTAVLDIWLDGTELMWKHRQNSNLVRLYRATRPCIDLWREHWQRSVVTDGYYARTADRNAAKFSVANVLDVWPSVAIEAKKERMMRQLRHFRRDYKIDLASSVLDIWREEMLDSVDDGTQAHNLHVQHRRDDINDCLAWWGEYSQRVRLINSIAGEAEQEYWCGVWMATAQELAVNGRDAADYDSELLLAHCWNIWDFEVIQMKSLGQTVGVLRERDDHRLTNQVLDDWLLRARPDSTHFDLLQFSTMSRRSTRLQQRSQYGAPPLSLLDNTPARPQQLRGASPGSSRPPGSALSLQYPGTTPVPSGMFGATLDAQTQPLGTTPGIWRAQGSAFGRPQNTQGIPPSRSRSRPPSNEPNPLISILQSRRRQLFQTPREPGSFRPSGSVRFQGLGPMTEFDDDESFLADLETGDGFMSTPTRWTGSARPLGNRATETPSAILPSPDERKLRAQYGRGSERRVGFSDIREETFEEEEE
ncbi:hypothetical protein OQA88_12404 [Cercophora sp. LCS_1]